MKRLLPSSLLVICLSCFFIVAHSQDMGYKTIDVGGEFQTYSKGFIFNLHLAYNFPVHHALLLRLGYNKSNWKDEGKHDNEEGGGPGFSLGYRYYFPVRPHGFFLGARVDQWRMNINWREGNLNDRTKITVFQPSVETGYMFLINDQFFVTPSLAGAFQANIRTQGSNVGDGFIFLVGVSGGWKF